MITADILPYEILDGIEMPCFVTSVQTVSMNSAAFIFASLCCITNLL